MHPYNKHPDNAGSWFNELEGGRKQVFGEKQVIVSPGSRDNKVFVMESGRARICLFSDTKEQTLGYLKPGSVYVTHSPAWVEALEQTSIRSWPIQEIKSLLISQPDMVLSTIREVGMMLNNAIEMIENLSFRSVESRLAHYLITESQQHENLTIRLIGNTEILASLLGTSRQTTSTILNKFEKAGLIARPDREIVTLLNLDELKNLANPVSAS